jgi:hypothetical protein
MPDTVAQAIGFYSYLFTSPLGFLGHACSLITFSAKPLRQTSTRFLFICLTLSDLLYLIISILDFITLTLLMPIIRNDHLCRFRIFIINVTTVTSSWFLVLIAVDRLIRARFPYRQARLCTRKIAMFSVCIITIFSALFTCHILRSEVAYTSQVSQICGPAPFPFTAYSLFYYKIWPIIQLLVTYFIPSCVMIICVAGVHSKLRAQRTQIAASIRKEKLQRQMLILMISSVACFAICTIPYSIEIIVFLRSGSYTTGGIELYLFTALRNVNYSYNFYIHCLTSKLFRQTFVQQLAPFYKLCKRPRQADNGVYVFATKNRPVGRSVIG